MSIIAGSLEHLVSEIVDEPGAMRISEKSLRHGKLLEARVTPTDLGQAVGYNGRTARVLRYVATAPSTNGLVRVDVIDQERY